STHLADGAYLAGFLSLKKGDFQQALTLLSLAKAKHEQLNLYFTKYVISALMSLPISAEITVHVQPDLSGVLLGLVEVFQQQKQWKRAEECLERLRQLDPKDAVVKLFLAELLVQAYPADKRVSQQIVQLAEGIENESAVHAALLLYKAKALRTLGFLSAARDTLTAAMRRKKGRSDELLRALRYERAQTYEELRQKSLARTEFEKIYAEAPAYEDVAERLGLF
ncbi:MAG: tetratricopeptide repeat protein, partial [Geopsychrobacter sp.]|nr:tetratricopeptide repeat protein [Geopsychrobacter sp.]